LTACAVALALPALTSAHIERASYWPDPGVDTADGQPTGGAVPDARPLFTALDASTVSETRVVCDGGQTQRLQNARTQGSKGSRSYERAVNSHPSMQRLDAALADAVANGYELQPSEPPVAVTQAEADELRAFNARLLDACRYDSIQAAVNDSGNNDRVVVMPGIYTEPDSRAAPTNDPSCDQFEEQNDRGSTGANSYRYGFHCPNDQNLVAVLGREPGPEPAPQPPLDDRHGIPDEGPCIRCNLQIEGSGIGPDDVVIDAGNVASGNGAPADPAKDVGLKIDRADGSVVRNLTVRHAREHGIYPHEVDGYRIERFRVAFNEEYGVLAFTSDHGLIQDCDAFGSGDAAIYPGSAPDTGAEVTPPDTQRLNTEIRRCDMRHSAIGYSGTAANAVWLHHNDFYDNALGFSTDVFTAAGHPGFPQDSDLLEHNEFYSNNFNPYVDQPADTEVMPTVPVPVGTGMWIAGGNNNEVRDNRFWDNWRRGMMLFSVPDAFVCGPQTGNSQHGCDPSEVNTSFDNRFHHNVMGRNPDGEPDPNGTDFWWDQFAGNTGNCWFENTGPDGTRSSLTADPPLFPQPGRSIPGFLPEDCATSMGTGGKNEAELVSCLANFEGGAPTPCTWFETPREPQP
jgi:hypothetical protein